MENDYYCISGFLTVTEVAGILGISRSTALTLIRKGQIPSIRVRCQIRVPETGFVKYLQDAGLDVEQIYWGAGHLPTTAPPAPLTTTAQPAEREPTPGVQVR